MDNKFPGKDISDSDLKDKFPLAAKKSPNHYSKFRVCGIEFGGKKYQLWQDQIWLKTFP